MKFDIIVGNPPYNNDLYLDFVTVGNSISTSYSLWITPAKWQAKGGNKNIQFRKIIVPYINKVVYYKDVKEVFDIGEPDGVSYYLIDKNNIHSTKLVRNNCSNKIFKSDWEEHTEKELILLPNKIIGIINKCNNITLYKRLIHKMLLDNSEYGGEKTHENNVAIVCGDNGASGYISEAQAYNLGVHKYINYIHCLVSQGSGSPFDKENRAVGRGMKRVHIAGNMELPQGHYFALTEFNSEQEAKSFTSFCDTKLIRFLYFIGISASMEIIENWRFIPDPLEFNHLYTDKELYDKYELTKDEINIIESIIK